jgi:hypothetical protein
MSCQDIGILGSKPGTSFLLGLRGLASGGGQARVKSGKLGGNRSPVDPSRRQPHAVCVQHEHRSDRDSRADCDSAQDLHRKRCRGCRKVDVRV